MKGGFDVILIFFCHVIVVVFVVLPFVGGGLCQATANVPCLAQLPRTLSTKGATSNFSATNQGMWPRGRQGMKPTR